MVAPKLVLFDFDGVIANSLSAAVNAFGSLYPDLSREDYLRQHEGNVYELDHVKEQLAKKSTHELDWWGEYSKHVHTVVPHEGMVEVVRELSTSYPLFIISSTTTAMIEESLEKFGLTGCFQQILGADVHTSKVVKLRSVIEEYQTTPKNCLFITDTLGDLRQAAEVQVPCLAVAWGFHDIATLEKGSPEAILLSPHDLIGKINELLR